MFACFTWKPTGKPNPFWGCPKNRQTDTHTHTPIWGVAQNETAPVTPGCLLLHAPGFHLGTPQFFSHSHVCPYYLRLVQKLPVGAFNAFQPMAFQPMPGESIRKRLPFLLRSVLRKNQNEETAHVGCCTTFHEVRFKGAKTNPLVLWEFRHARTILVGSQVCYVRLGDPFLISGFGFIVEREDKVVGCQSHSSGWDTLQFKKPFRDGLFEYGMGHLCTWGETFESIWL